MTMMSSCESLASLGTFGVEVGAKGTDVEKVVGAIVDTPDAIDDSSVDNGAVDDSAVDKSSVDDSAKSSALQLSWMSGANRSTLLTLCVAVTLYTNVPGTATKTAL